jgi:hypothetical protein
LILAEKIISPKLSFVRIVYVCFQPDLIKFFEDYEENKEMSALLILHAFSSHPLLAENSAENLSRCSFVFIGGDVEMSGGIKCNFLLSFHACFHTRLCFLHCVLEKNQNSRNHEN